MNLSFLELFENRITENAEDEYVAKHKTGYISPSAYARSEEPGGLGGRSVEKCPKVIGTMAIRPVDGLNGTHKSGKTYKEIFDLVKEVKSDVSKLKEGDGLEIRESYPKWFRDVHFQYKGRWYTLNRKTDGEISDRGYLNNSMARHILWDVLKIEHIIEDGIMDRDDGGGEAQITFRQTGEKSQYVRTDEEGDVVRDSNGNASYFTDEEMLAKGYPIEDDTVYAFDGPNCIGYASNEFGAVGIFVERNYQRQGIGKELLRLYQAQFKKEKKLGQMTPAGEQLTRSYYRTHVAGKGVTESGDSVIIGCTKSILSEDLTNRLKWVVNNDKNSVTAFLTLDAILSWRPSYASDIRKGAEQIASDVRSLDNNRYDPSVPETNTLTDAQVIEKLKQMMNEWLSTGKWYDNSTIPDRSPLEKLVGWIHNWVRKGVEATNEIKTFIRFKNEIADWFMATRPNIMSLKPSQAAARSHRWHAAMARKDADRVAIEGTKHLKKVAELGDGVEIYELTVNDLKDEGATMKHCIGRMPRYTDGITKGTHKAFSIRRDGKRLYTVFTTTEKGNIGGHSFESIPTIEQFKAKTNLIPGQKGTDIEAAVAAKRWFKSQGYYVKCHDLHILALDESSLFEGGIEGTPITADEAIKACGIRNRETGEVIEDDFHFEAWQAAWSRGWFKEIGEKWPYFKDATLKEILDIQPGEKGTPGGYEMIEEIVEDGFVTTKGRFLSRKEALAIARKARQIKPKMRPDDDMIQYSSKSSEKTYDPHLRAEELTYAESLLAEMPIGKFELLGDWSPGAKPRGYDKPSIGIVTSQAGVEKIRQKWAKVDETFDIYLVRSPKGYKQVEVGEVSPQWVQSKLGINLEYDDNKITMIYTNNKGSEKVPMTPWTLAHRFGHASSRMFKDSSYSNDESNPIMHFTRQLDSSLTKIAQVVYGISQLRGYDGYYSGPENYPRKEVIFRQICQNLGTMKSCRDGNLRNWGEFAFEVLAQYMITGKVSLNRNLKSVLPTRFAWGKPQGPWKRSMSPEQQIAVEGIIDDLETEAENYAFETLKRAIGRIYVM